MPDLSTLTLGFGVYIIVFSLCFLASLPLIGERHEKGEDITGFIWRMVFADLGAALVLTLAGWWVVGRYF